MASNEFDFTQLLKQFDPQEVISMSRECFNIDLSAVNEVHTKTSKL